MNNFSLRAARDSDIAFLYRLYASTREREMEMLEWTDQQKQQFLQMQFNAQHSYYHEHFGAAQFNIIEQDGVAIGRLYVDRRPAEIRIIDIALLPEHRAKGVGGALMRALITEAGECNRAVGIHVEHNNPALRLYRRLGFKHVRDEGVYYFMEWRRDVGCCVVDQEKTAS
jgi:ribosomal protein S18 acetylase RimI-like enzyme